MTNITINNYTDNTTTVETIDYDEIGNPRRTTEPSLVVIPGFYGGDTRYIAITN